MGTKNLTTTMRNITSRIVDDEVLEKYSYEGMAQKLPFKGFDNITKLIVQTTMDAHNYFNAGTQDYKEVSLLDVSVHFEDKFLKYAKQRKGKR